MGSTQTENTTSPARPLPKGPSWRTLATLALVALVALVIGVTLAKPIRAGLSHAANALNQKSMSEDHADHAGHTGTDQTRYTCGMHPWVILPEPGDCPICHMKLVPVDENKFTDKITIDPSITQRIGVRTTAAVMAPAHRTIQTTGSITWDESALHEISLKYTGWIEKLHVDTVGQPVKKGELLFEIYSPAVYVAQEEYLTLWRRIKANSTSTDDRLLEAARRRLQFLDVTAEQIKSLEKRNASQKTIGVYSPADGFVVERNVTQGASVTMNTLLYRIADISKVWVMASVYEQDLPWVSSDMPATMTLPYEPGKIYKGSLTYIYPYLDTTSRQASARLVFDNPDHFLKPGMFAQVNLQADLKGDRLLIPRQAVVDTGKRQIAFVAKSQGQFEPRTLTLGANVQNGLIEVLTGIDAGEKVVTQGQFLLDSESNMRQNLAQMTSPQSQAAASDAKEQDTPQRILSSKNAASLNAFIDVYLAMSDQLAANENDLSANAKILSKHTAALATHPMPGQADFWQKHDQPAQIITLAQALNTPQALPQTREQFLKISVLALDLLRATGVPPGRDKPIQQIECAMYQHDTQGGIIPAGGQWITPTGEIRNPYFGPMMLGCYTDEAKLPIATIQNDQAKNDQAEMDASDEAIAQPSTQTTHGDHQ